MQGSNSAQALQVEKACLKTAVSTQHGFSLENVTGTKQQLAEWLHVHCAG